MDKQSKHTPGPWKADRTVIRDANGRSIASGGNNRVIQGDELAASLQLAAAAPDLLAALESMVKAGEAQFKSSGWPAYFHNGSLEAARAAIAKAKGA